MKEKTKKVLLVVLMVAMLILLTGCANVNMEVRVNSDGSADVSYVMGYDQSFLSSMSVTKEDLADDDTFEDSMEEARTQGYTVESYEDENTYGFKASKHIDNIAEFSMQDVAGSDTEVAKNDGIAFEKSLLKTVISQDAIMDLSDFVADEDSDTSAMTNMILNQMKITYKVVLPFSVGENNATKVSEDGKTLEWTLKPGEVNEIKFVASQDYSIFAIIGSIVLIVVIALIVIVVAEKKKKTKKETKPLAEEPKKEAE